MRDRATATAEDRDVASALLFQVPNDLGEKINVPTVVTGNSDGGDILLNRRAHDVPDIAMKPEIDHLNAMPDKFEIDRIDGTVVSIANRDGRENADW
jgi:hypothetical protein